MNYGLNRAGEDTELLDALDWKYRKIVTERDDAVKTSAMTDDEAYHEPAALLAEIRRLHEALTRIAKMRGTYGYEETYSTGAYANEIASEALTGKKAGQPHSAWPTGPGYRKGDICQPADGTIWRCVEDGITGEWERGKAKEAGK